MSEQANQPPTAPPATGKAQSVRAWKCLNCVAKNGIDGGFDFEAARPKCPKCGADRDKNHTAVVPRVIVHFDPPTVVAWKGKNTLACDPALKIGQQGRMASGDHRVVTCPKCRATPEFLASVAGAEDMSNVVEQPDEEPTT